MSDKIILCGLKASDYIHPDEENFQTDGLMNFTLVQKGLDMLNDGSVQLLRQITDGKWVELTEQTAPDLFDALKEVEAVLDFKQIPRIFVKRDWGFQIDCGGTDYMQMLIPDYITENYDSEMLSFVLGKAIGLFKSRHVQLNTICSVLCDNVALRPVQLALKACLRTTNLTDDRAGLLACQNISAAIRCLLVEAGFPLSELRFLDEEETLTLAKNYLEEMDYMESDLTKDIAAFWKNADNMAAPVYLRLQELLNWYDEGYDNVLKKRGGELP